MCKENEYMCKSGKNCIPLDYICDGVTDCEDNDDEAHCNRKRDQKEFRSLVFNSHIVSFESCVIKMAKIFRFFEVNSDSRLKLG